MLCKRGTQGDEMLLVTQTWVCTCTFMQMHVQYLNTVDGERFAGLNIRGFSGMFS